MDDLLIRGGLVVDGTGVPGRPADVVVSGERITTVESSWRGDARRTIDARDRIVAPGFIDIHTHSDFTLPVNPRAESKVRQGVTTEVVGNCGFSAAPVLPGMAAMLGDYLAASAPALTFRETTFARYLDEFPPTAVNTIMQVGHNTLRLMTMGMDRRAPTGSERAHMEALLTEALEAGAMGLSSGLFTAPGSYAEPDEIVGLARVLARHEARYASHVRDEADGVFDAVREAIAVAEAAGVHVQIGHLKLSRTAGWGGAAKLLAEIDAARRRGVPVDCDQYPYDTATNPLRNLLPSWVQEGGLPAMLERLAQPAIRARIRADVARSGLNNFGAIPSWDAVRIAVSPTLPDEAGQTIGVLARRRGVDPLDVVSDVVVADRGATRILITSMAEADVDAITGAPWVLVGSDENAREAHGVTGRGKPHPRAYGTFARVLGRCVRERGLLTLPQAIFKMTGGAAAALGLTDRGVLAPGAWADITIFDPLTIADQATYDDPHRYAAGVSTVVVNGTVVIDGGAHTGALPGRVLRFRGGAAA